MIETIKRLSDAFGKDRTRGRRMGQSNVETKTICLEVERLEDREMLSGDWVPDLPSIVKVSGQQLIVRDRLPDGTLSTPTALVAKGVAWEPHSKGTSVNLLHLEPRTAFRKDIPLMQRMGVNVVRVYHDFGVGDKAIEILDAFYEAGIKLIMTVDSPRHAVVAKLPNIVRVVNAYKDHPSILAWNVGNEWDVNGYFGKYDTLRKAALFTELAASRIQSLDNKHPVTTAIADPHIPQNATGFTHPLSKKAFPFIENVDGYTNNIVNKLVPSIDFWSIQIYRGASFQDVFQQWASISTKPVLVSEFGADAFDHRINADNQEMQSSFNAGLWDELYFNLSAEREGAVAIGGVVFEFCDEWWKIGNPSIHDVSDEPNGGQPDGFNDEEWFGVVDINRQPRKSYYVMRQRFDNGQSAIRVTRSPVFKATSQLGGQAAFTQFQIDGKVVFERGGGGGGARGINVALLDEHTGIRLKEVNSFDTWLRDNSPGGPHKNFSHLVDYLNNLPDGAIVAIAIADESGFIDPQTGNPWNEAIIEQAYLALEELGSTKIRDVGYNGGWAMIAVKGQGKLAEKAGGAFEEVTTQKRLSLNIDLDAGRRKRVIEFAGTQRNDKFEFRVSKSNKYVVTVNGNPSIWDPAIVSALNFRGLGGQDSIVLIGGQGNESAMLRPGAVEFTGAGYHLQATSVETVRSSAGTGSDRAFLYDSANNDKLNVTPTSGLLTGSGFSNRVAGFDRVYVQTMGGSNDRAVLHDSARNDRFVATPDFAQLSGRGFFVSVRGFEQVQAYAVAGGNDVALLHDSNGRDTYYGRMKRGRLYGKGFSNTVLNFDNVQAIADANGKDTIDAKNLSYILKKLGDWEVEV